MGRGSLRIALALAALLAAAVPACAEAASGDAYRATIRGRPTGSRACSRPAGATSATATATRSQPGQLCTIADSYVTVDAQRSRYFGPDASWTFRGNGFTFNNLDSDFFFQKIIDDRRDREAPAAEAAARAEAAGHARSRAATPPATTATWRRPASTTSPTRAAAASRGCARSRRRTSSGASTSSALLASQGVAIDGISRPRRRAGAALPRSARSHAHAASDRASSASACPSRHRLQRRRASARRRPHDGHGMLLGNPHFPWDGSERFYQAQLTIPGRSTSPAPACSASRWC